jgi:Lrp/AsnC family leucine-responsive transcriptional regulator
LLNENSRESYAELGRKIGLSASSVRDRLQHLTDIGVIRKFTLELDQSLLGKNLEAFVLIRLFPSKLMPFLSLVNQFEGVEKSYRITGEQNVLMRVALKDHKELQVFLDKIRLYGDTTSYLMLSEITDNRSLLSDIK